MTESLAESRQQLLLLQAADCERALVEIARRFAAGGETADAAMGELQTTFVSHVRGILTDLAIAGKADQRIAEAGGSILCTAVRLSEVVFSRDERVTWFEAFRSASAHFVQPGLKGQFLGNFGNALAESGRLDDAEAVLRERLDCAIQEKDRIAEGLGKEHLGKLFLRRGQFQEADRYLHEAFAIAESLGEESTTTRLLKDMAEAAFRRSEVDMGIEYLKVRLQRCEQRKDSLLILSTCHVLAERLVTVGQIEKSKQYITRAASLAKSMRLPPLRRASILGTMGNIAYEEAEFETARKHYFSARRIYRKLHRIIEQGMTAASLGLTAWKMGKLSSARRWFLESLEIDRSSGRSNDVAVSLGNLARVLAATGDYDGAVESYVERIEILEALNEWQRAADDRVTLARVYAVAGDFKIAMKTCEPALEYFSRCDKDKSNEIRTLMNEWFSHQGGTHGQ